MREEPVIIGFCCNECAYAAADLAGSMRKSYPYNIRIIRVPCSGQVDMMYILRAFDLGADGVFVAGCLEGGCHYVDGNLKAKRTVGFLKTILGAIGLGGDRLEMFFMSASDAESFVDAATKFVEGLTRLGGNPLKSKAGLYRVDSKRKAVSMMMGRMAASLGADMDELGIYVESIPAFKEITVNGDECIGCGACESACEYDAIKLIDSDGFRRVLYSYRDCRLCGECIEECLKEAVSYTDRVYLRGLVTGEPYEKARLELLRCPSCERPFVPERLYGEVKVPDLGIYRYCPDCRRSELSMRLSRCPLV